MAFYSELIQETETFLKHLQIEKTPSVHKAFKDNEAYLWIPSVVMLLIACRGFVFWCLNVILFNCVAINGKTIAKNAEKIGRSQTRSNYNGSTFSEVRIRVRYYWIATNFLMTMWTGADIVCMDHDCTVAVILIGRHALHRIQRGDAHTTDIS